MSIAKGGNIKKMKIFTIALISGLFTLIIGFMFMIIYWIGEQFGFAPVITLGTLEWFTSGEGIILFAVILMASIFIGSFIVLYMIKRFS
ncbi:hypothetical protein LCGC14_1123360 [marine sediment metagenome]|uniref:Uncharacterized protein n=1 Tax=marine sediment metagenome TaxID=412755 RepID=A0A0F9M842_9ZZZZ